MFTHPGRSRLRMQLPWLLLALLGSSCAAAQQYSRVAGQRACASFDQCTVYDGAGKHGAACFQPAGEVPQVFAGDSGWPLPTATCRPRLLEVPFAG